LNQNMKCGRLAMGSPRQLPKAIKEQT